MSLVSIRVPKELKKKMKRLRRNWSAMLRRYIEEVVSTEERQHVLDELIREIEKLPATEEGFSARSVREDRDSR